MLVVIVPAWVLGDGEYVGLGPGDRAAFGFALETARVVRRDSAPGITQTGEFTVLTTVAGRVLHPDEHRNRTDPAIVRGTGHAILAAVPPWISDDTPVVATGFLTVDPFRWAAGGELAGLTPQGVAPWLVRRVRVATPDGGSTELDRLPDEATADHDAVYLLDLVPAGDGRRAIDPNGG